jgi:hypothetical protein
MDTGGHNSFAQVLATGHNWTQLSVCPPGRRRTGKSGPAKPKSGNSLLLEELKPLRQLRDKRVSAPHSQQLPNPHKCKGKIIFSKRRESCSIQFERASMHHESHDQVVCPIRRARLRALCIKRGIGLLNSLRDSLRIVSRRVSSGSLVDHVRIVCYDFAESLVAYFGCA